MIYANSKQYQIMVTEMWLLEILYSLEQNAQYKNNKIVALKRINNYPGYNILVIYCISEHVWFESGTWYL